MAESSEGRYPDGTTNIIALSTPTPRAGNAGPLPPVLTWIVIQATPSPANDALIFVARVLSG